MSSAFTFLKTLVVLGLFFASLFIFSFVAPITLHAATTTPTGTTADVSNCELVPGSGVPGGLYKCPDGSYKTVGATGDVYGAKDGKATIESSVDWGCALPQNWAVCLLKEIAYLVLSIANWLALEAAFLFNQAMLYTVFGFSQTIGNSPGLLAAWGILRDIGNLLLLFGFIFVGIGTILNLHSYQAKKAIPGLVIFAVLLNFSLFAAEAVIDTSNLVSTTFYKQATGEAVCAPGTDVLAQKDDCTSYGIAGRILEMSGVSKQFDVERALPQLLQGDDRTKTMVAYLGLALFVGVSACVLMAGAILLIARAVILALVMVLAPVGFAGMALPFLKQYADQWWDHLIKQSFVAPIFLLLVFVSLKISESFNGLANGSNATLLEAAVNSNGSTTGVLIVFTLTIGLMAASILLAVKMGAFGAEFAFNIGKGYINRSLVRPVSATVLGGSAFALRRTVGGTSQLAAGGIRKLGSLTGQYDLARRASNFVAKAGNASMDVRGLAAVKGAAKFGGVDLGGSSKVAKKGVVGVQKDEADKKFHYYEQMEDDDKKKYKKFINPARYYEERAEIEEERGNHAKAAELNTKADKLRLKALESTNEGKLKEKKGLDNAKTEIAKLTKALEDTRLDTNERNALQHKLDKATERQQSAKARVETVSEGKGIDHLVEIAEQQERAYLRNLQSNQRIARRMPGVLSGAMSDAIGKIRSEQDKSPGDRDIDRIVKGLKKQGGDHDDHTEKSHDTPKAASPAGKTGGGPKAAPH